MSIKGKKAAILKNALKTAQSMVRLEIDMIDLHPLIAMTARESLKAAQLSVSMHISRAPRQYFNDDGKIDKRKQRRHDRKVGVKVHTARLIRANIGKPMKPIMIGIDPANGKDKSVRANVTIKNGLVADVAILDECGIHGDVYDDMHQSNIDELVGGDE